MKSGLWIFEWNMMPGHPDINNNIQRCCAANESLGPECTCVFRTRTSNLICLLSIMKLGLIMTKSSLLGFSECRMVVHSPTDHPNSFPVIFCLLPHWLFKPVKRSEEHAGVVVCAINTRTQEVEAGSSLEAT